MWSGSEWIPRFRPRFTTTQHARFGHWRNVIHTTTIHNDPSAVTEAVITALQQMGMLGQVVEQAPPSSPEVELPPTLGNCSRVFVNWKTMATSMLEKLLEQF